MSEQIINSPLTFRGSSKNRQQLEELANLWGEKSRSKVILRCIEWAWMVEVGATNISFKPGQIESLEEGENGEKQLVLPRRRSNQ